MARRFELGTAVGGNLEELEALMWRYQRTVLGLVVVGVVAGGTSAGEAQGARHLRADISAASRRYRE